MNFIQRTAFILAAFSATAGTAGTEPGAKQPAYSATSAYQGLVFVENKGQWPGSCRFRSTFGNNVSLFLEQDRLTYVLLDNARLEAIHHDMHGKALQPDNEVINAHAFQMVFLGGNTASSLTGSGQRSYHHNYYLGNDPSKWASHVPVFGGVLYKDLYAGIDLSMYESGGGLKYDYLLEAGADPGQIRIGIEGAESADIIDGRLVVKTSVGEIVESIPESYQEINGEKVKADCRYYRRADGTIGIRARYNSAYPLVIDPVVMASTYSGGTSTAYGHCATFDKYGNIYAGARSFNTGYPVKVGAFQTTFGGIQDVGVSKLDPNGVTLIHATYLGGSLVDLPHSMFVDASDNLFVFGSTRSANFPVTTGAYDQSQNGDADIFISKLNPSGTTLLGGTFVGGSGADGINTSVLNYSDDFRGEIVVDDAGNPFVASVSASSGFPVTNGAYDVSFNGMQDGVVFKMNANLTSLVWSTFLGTSQKDGAFSLRLAANGDVVVTGATCDASFPTTTGAVNTTYLGGPEDGYIARLDANGATLLNSTFVGSTLRDLSFFVDLDVSGNIYVYGNTLGTTPITNGVYNTPGSQNFLMKFNPSLSSLMWGTAIGDGTHGSFAPSALMVDICDNVYMSGWGQAGAYPLTNNAVQTNTIFSGFHLIVLDGSATTLLYAGPFGAGGEHVDGGTSRFDPSGMVYQGVCACNTNFPTKPGNYAPVKLSNSCDMAVFKIDFQTNCTGFSSSTVICSGSAATFSIVNYGNLSNPTFSVMPGPISPVNQVFTVSPAANTTYTVYITGTNTNNAVVTSTGTAIVIVKPQMAITPSFTQASCTSSNNAFNLSLIFTPSTSPTPSYQVTWAPVPGGIASNTQLASAGPIAPGVYAATITSQAACSTAIVFTISPVPPPVVFYYNQPPVINCTNPTLSLTVMPSTYNYTWTSPSSMQTGNTATFVGTGPLNWTVTAVDPVFGCSSFTAVTITQHTSNVSSVLTPTYQNITCTVNSINSVTATANPTVNIMHHWTSSYGGTVITYGNKSIYTPGGPGVYTHVAINLNDGCKTVKTFTVFSNEGFPTFTLTSPQNFTVGCASKSVALVNMENAQTTPTAGGSITYTMLSGASATNYGTGTVSTFGNISVPGTYTFLVRATNNGCETKVQASITQNTLAPQISAIVPNIITCYKPSVLLEGKSTDFTADISWRLPPSSMVDTDTLRVYPTSVETATVVGTYTAVALDPNNACVSTSVVTVLQNIIPPIAEISGGTELSCKTISVTLSNNSRSRIPPYFNPTGFVAGYLWTGPSPQEPLQMSSNYVALMPGTYTMVARDMSNGCMAIATKTIMDNRIYPLVNTPDRPGPFILDCGVDGVEIYPNIFGGIENLVFDWEADGIVSSMSGPTITAFSPGRYGVEVTDTETGCSAIGTVDVMTGTLSAAFTHSQHSQFAPAVVSFTNLSASNSTITGTQSIVSIWTYGNGELDTTLSVFDNPSTLIKEPGTYTLVMNVAKGTCLDTAWAVIYVEAPSRLIIPNVFTPNGDGSNDLFFVNGAMLTEIYTVIFDRWGNKVYEVTSNTGNIEWDGNNLYGKAAAEGVYYIALEAKGKDGTTYDTKATVTLLR